MNFPKPENAFFI